MDVLKYADDVTVICPSHQSLNKVWEKVIVLLIAMTTCIKCGQQVNNTEKIYY